MTIRLLRRMLRLDTISKLPDNLVSHLEWLVRPNLYSAARQVVAGHWVRQIVESNCRVAPFLFVVVVAVVVLGDWCETVDFVAFVVALVFVVDAAVDAAARKLTCCVNRPAERFGLLFSDSHTLPGHASNPVWGQRLWDCVESLWLRHGNFLVAVLCTTWMRILIHAGKEAGRCPHLVRLSLKLTRFMDDVMVLVMVDIVLVRFVFLVCVS